MIRQAINKIFDKLKYTLLGKLISIIIYLLFPPKTHTQQPFISPQFNQLAQQAKKKSYNISQKLTLYSLYKQTIQGPCSKPQPSKIKIQKYAKWQAWKQLGNMSKQQAQNNYIQFVKNSNKNQTNIQKNQLSKSVSVMKKVQNQQLCAQNKDVQKLFQLINYNNKQEVKKIIQSDQNILYEFSSSGINILHYVIDVENLDMFYLILPYYSNINIKDETGLTPLHYAVLIKNPQIIKELIKKNVDIYIKDNQGFTVLDVCINSLKPLLNKQQ